MIDKPYQMDLDADGNLRLIFDKAGTIYLSEEIPHLLATLIECNRSLQKCCTQRGARMQIMKEWMDEILLGYRTDWDVFLDKNPEAFNWFDENGNVR